MHPEDAVGMGYEHMVHAKVRFTRRFAASCQSDNLDSLVPKVADNSITPRPSIVPFEHAEFLAVAVAHRQEVGDIGVLRSPGTRDVCAVERDSVSFVVSSAQPSSRAVKGRQGGGQGPIVASPACAGN